MIHIIMKIKMLNMIVHNEHLGSPIRTRFLNNLKKNTDPYATKAFCTNSLVVAR